MNKLLSICRIREISRGLFTLALMFTLSCISAAASAPDPHRLCSLCVALRTPANSAGERGAVTVYAVEERAESADALAGYLSAQGADGLRAVPNAEGLARFTQLAQGRYLVVQTEETAGYQAFAPFFVDLPLREAESGDPYHVTAAPKIAPQANDPPAQPDTAGRLPYTGQLWWPVPVLLLCGACLLALARITGKTA